jgi:hypothetical protein
MQSTAAMMITKKKAKKVLKGALAALPAIHIMRSRRQRMSIAAYVLGGVSAALVGGIAALMYLSPRTRTRALSAAKDTYGKVNDRISHLKSHYGDKVPMANGLVDREYSAPNG